MADEKQDAGAADDALGYEQAREALLEVVRNLEAGGSSLEESLALWERGERLAKVCQRWLDGARARLDAALAEESDDPDDPNDPEEGDQAEEERGGATAAR